MSLDTLIASIAREAQAEAERIGQQARDEAARIRQEACDRAQAEAAQRRQARVDACRKETQQQLSQARLQARNRVLEVRQELVEAVFAEALDTLRTMDDEAYRAWMKRRLLDLYRSDEETVVVSENDRGRLTDGWRDEVNAALARAGHPHAVRIEYAPDGPDGGFLLRHPRYEVDVSFGALLDALKKQLRAEIAAALFDVEYADVLDHGF